MTLRVNLDLLARRSFLQSSTTGLGVAALGSLLARDGLSFENASGDSLDTSGRGSLKQFHTPPKAKAVIYLVMSGGPSHIDLLDYKPQLKQHHGEDLPASIRMGQRITGMTSGQKSFPCASSIFKFAPQGKCGAYMSELLPHMGGVADDMTIIKSMHTEAINHDPAITFLQTGSQQPGRPSLGAWLNYGLGSETDNLPGFVVMISQGSGNKTDQPIFSRLWGAGFLPSEYQGVRFRSGANPVLYLQNPPGVDAQSRREMLDGVQALNAMAADEIGDPEINTRISQYEMAFRMQTSAPELTDLTKEDLKTLEAYGINDSNVDGGFARHCLLARRMVERGVRYIQLMHRGWDQHSALPGQIRGQCSDVDKPTAALIADLKQRGLLDSTIVVWGGEFGRTVYSQGALTATDYGRDHHGRCFSLCVAGGGFKPGLSYGATDDYCYNITENAVPVHDFNATILNQMGIDHTRLTFRYQGRDFRLTDVEGNVVKAILA
jgi:hypothetical protein